MATSRARELMEANKGYYGGLLRTYEGRTNGSTEQIDRDIERTFPGQRIVDSVAGRESLRRVLKAYSFRNPSIGYCQSLNFVCATALLFLTEEEAFWLVAAISEKLLAVYYTKQMVNSQVDIRVLQQLVEEKCPQVAQHLQRNGITLDVLCTGWFLTIFTTYLPIECVLRAWDCLFLEGSKILFRVVIAAFRLHSQAILAIDDIGSLMGYLRTMLRRTPDPDLLLEAAFNQIGSLPMSKIMKLREVHKAAFLEEQKALQKKRKLSTAQRKSWMIEFAE